MRRLWTLLLVAAACVGCGPGESGVIGLTVDDAGRTVVVLQDCKGDIDRMKLVMLGKVAGDPETVLVNWSNPKSPKGIVQFPLVEGAGKWKPAVPVPDLDPARRYQLRGSKKPDSTKAAGITFTAAMVKALTPGQVLRWKVGPGDTNETVTLDEFTPDDCG